MMNSTLQNSNMRNAMRKVLIVDDSQLILRSMQNIFSRIGFEVHTASDGQTGLDHANDINPDLIVTDLHMPGMDGVAFLNSLKAKDTLANIPTFMISTESKPSFREKAADAGAVAWLEKPIIPDDLLNSLRSIFPGL